MNHDNCQLSIDGAPTVGGVGPITATIMVIGEAPGRQEVLANCPFVGASGRMLNVLLTKGLRVKREDVYITNVVKHLPPRKPPTPTTVEIRQCLPHLMEELETVNPSIVITVGAIPLSVFCPKQKITKEHGVARVVDGRVIVPWIHPAAAMRPGGANYLQLMKADSERFWTTVGQVGGKIAPVNYQLSLGGGKVEPGSVVGFDTETTSPRRANVFLTDEAAIVGYSVSTEPRQGYYVSPTTKGILEELVTSPSITKVVHNAKFEIKVLSKLGLQLTNYEDTMLAAYILGEPQVGLKPLTRQLLGIEPITYKQVTNGKDMAQLPPSAVVDYACADADHTRQLWYVLQPRLVREQLYDIYRDVELPLVQVLARMESSGVRCDIPRAKNLLSQLTTTVGQSIAEVKRQLDVDNPNSHEQLGQRLEAFGFPIVKRTRVKRTIATDSETLLSVRGFNSTIVDAVLQMRQLSKLKSYLDNWIELADDRGYIHTSFNQAGHYEEAGTDARSTPQGRLSSSDPNMQNIPHHSNEAWGQLLRSCIVPSTGNVLLAADVEQEEPRIIAYLANDYTLKEGFDSGTDIYRPATVSIYPYTDRPDLDDGQFKRQFGQERYYGKTFFLAWYYGGTEKTLAAIDSRIGRANAKRGIVRLGDNHPARQSYVETIEGQLERDGYVQSLFGRKKWIPLYATGRVKDKAEAVRIGANAVIQMTAADILKMAMTTVDRQLTTRQLKSRMVLTIHDELIFDADKDEVRQLTDIVTTAFQSIAPFRLPMDIRVGENWGEL